MRVLVTGAGGFAGRHTAVELKSAGHQVLALDLPGVPPPPADDTAAGDVTDQSFLEELVARWQPDGCIHLAGLAFVPAGWDDPERAFAINLMGTLRLLEAFRKRHPVARLLIVTSAEIYGACAEPVTEDSPPAPQNVYAVSKLAADFTARLYAARHRMPVVVARPGNHIGPGQSPRFVAMSFAYQLVDIERRRLEPVLRVGNLESERGFVDVRDVARAYRLLLEQGRPGEAYNIGSPIPVRIADLLDQLLRLTGVRPTLVTDPARYRPADRSGVLDCRKIRNEVGWEPRIPLADTLRDILEDARRAAPV